MLGFGNRRGGDMFERFTDDSRRVVVLAQEECRRLHDVEIRTEHFLLALAVDGDSAAAAELRGVGLSSKAIRTAVADRHSRRRRESSGHVPFTSHAKQVLERAAMEADRLGRRRIPSLVLLLGLLSVEDGGAVAVLRSLGVDVAALASAAEQATLEPVGEHESSVEVGRPVACARRDTYSASNERLALERDRFAHALRRYGRHDADCLGTSACSCGLQPILDDVPSDEGESTA